TISGLVTITAPVQGILTTVRLTTYSFSATNIAGAIVQVPSASRCIFSRSTVNAGGGSDGESTVGGVGTVTGLALIALGNCLNTAGARLVRGTFTGRFLCRVIAVVADL